MTHTLYCTSGGVYTEVKAENGEYIYEEQVILAPPGTEKTTKIGTQIKYIFFNDY